MRLNHQEQNDQATDDHKLKMRGEIWLPAQTGYKQIFQ